MIANCLGITIHWIDGDFCQRSTILELEPLRGDRTGSTLAEAFEKTLAKFGVWARIGHITTDGGSDMLLMVRNLAQSIPGFTAENNGLRCLAHILNKAVHRMFTALHCEGFDNEEVALDRLNLKPSNAPRQDLYKNVALPYESHAPAPPPHPHPRRAIPLNPFKHEVEQQAQAVLPTDELEQYKLMSPMAEDVWADRFESNAQIWWAESCCHLFPRLALMAKDYFSAQGQSHSIALSPLSNIGILKRRQHHPKELFRPPEMRRARIRTKCHRRRYRRL
jgi:hypothetical protein